jgi:hypothetical protein
LEDNGVESLDMINEVSFEVLDIYLKIFLLLYADDTVPMSENVDGMQTMLNVFSEYYKTWELQVNIAKTKVVIFSKSKVTQNTRVMSDNKELDICESYNYLVILFNFNNNFLNAKKKTCRASIKGFILCLLQDKKYKNFIRPSIKDC